MKNVALKGGESVAGNVPTNVKAVGSRTLRVVQNIPVPESQSEAPKDIPVAAPKVPRIPTPLLLEELAPGVKPFHHSAALLDGMMTKRVRPI